MIVNRQFTTYSSIRSNFYQGSFSYSTEHRTAEARNAHQQQSATTLSFYLSFILLYYIDMTEISILFPDQHYS